MKAKIKRHRSKSLPAARPRAVKSGRRAPRALSRAQRSRRNLTYFYAQLFVVLGIFAGISRCSPLAPSQSVESWQRDQAGSSALSSTVNPAVLAAVAPAPRPATPAPDFDAEINARVEIVVSSNIDPRTPNNILRLALSQDERSNLIRRAEVPLSIRARAEAMNLISPSDIQANLQALKDRGATRSRVTIKIYIARSSLTPTIEAHQMGIIVGARISALNSETPSLSIGTLQGGLGWNAYAAALQAAQAVYLDIQ